MGAFGVNGMLAKKIKLVDERYLLQEQVAQGGPVELYFALDRQLQRPVALEILSASAAKDQAICDRFHRHQRSASAVHHPNVLEIYDAGEWHGRPYIVMARDAGQPPLGEGVAKDATPDLSAALRMTRRAAEAVAFCRQAGLDDWPFSYKTVRIGTSGNAQIALLEDTHFGDTDGRFVSRRHADDPPALAALFRLLISGMPDSEGMQPYVSTLPASVAVVLRQMEPHAQDSFASAGEVAEALKEIEAASNDYTQANELPQSVQQGVVVLPLGSDLQRTSSLAEAPTLAVNQQSAVPSVPYVPASGSTAQASTIAALAVVASSATPLDSSRPYVPSAVPEEDESGRKRRVAPFLVLPLLGLLLLLAGATAFIARPPHADSTIVSNNQAALPTSTTAAAPPVAVPELLGKSLEEATSAAEELGIGLSVLDPVHSSHIPRDKVATQDPAPRVELPAGGIVIVAFSLGPQPVEDDEEEEEDQGVAPQPEQKQSLDKKKNNGKKK